MSSWSLQTFINNFFEPKHKQQWRGTPLSTGGGVNLKESCLSVAVVTQNEERKLDTFLQILGQPIIDLEELRTASWRGIPEQVRPLCWQLLLGYIPCDSERRLIVLEEKRNRYFDKVALHFEYTVMGEEDEAILTQIDLDIPRTIPRGLDGDCLNDLRLQKIMRRALYIWSKENGGTTYFQGLTDVLCQMMLTLLSLYVDPSHFSEEVLSAQAVYQLEADTFWCFSIFMDSMRHYYTQNLNVGMQAALSKVREIVHMVDETLITHLEREGLELIHFALRWMLCLFTREFHYSCVSRIWDTYFAEGEHFMADYHAHLCASIVLKYRKQLHEMDFSEALTMLQHLPTEGYTIVETEELIWRACVLRRSGEKLKDMCVTAAFAQMITAAATGKMIEQAVAMKEETKKRRHIL